jgi:hypothetical protein
MNLKKYSTYDCGCYGAHVGFISLLLLVVVVYCNTVEWQITHPLKLLGLLPLLTDWIMLLALEWINKTSVFHSGQMKRILSVRVSQFLHCPTLCLSRGWKLRCPCWIYAVSTIWIKRLGFLWVVFTRHNMEENRLKRGRSTWTCPIRNSLFLFCETFSVAERFAMVYVHEWIWSQLWGLLHWVYKTLRTPALSMR